MDADCVPGLAAEPEDARLLEAALAWELATGRKATADDEGAVRERRRMMDDATSAATAAGNGQRTVHQSSLS